MTNIPKGNVSSQQTLALAANKAIKTTLPSQNLIGESIENTNEAEKNSINSSSPHQSIAQRLNNINKALMKGVRAKDREQNIPESTNNEDKSRFGILLENTTPGEEGGLQRSNTPQAMAEKFGFSMPGTTQGTSPLDAMGGGAGNKSGNSGGASAVASASAVANVNISGGSGGVSGSGSGLDSGSGVIGSNVSTTKTNNPNIGDNTIAEDDNLSG